MTEYRPVRLNAGTGYQGGTETIDGAACLTCGVTLLGSTHPYPRDGEWTLAEAKATHSAWHQVGKQPATSCSLLALRLKVARSTAAWAARDWVSASVSWS